ncbi:hypothetical protein BS78_04G023900 [Paspalum vaginatum]|nr:hypothetical protein BS78_04G023900 [Paspalum vaginatum]
MLTWRATLEPGVCHALRPSVCSSVRAVGAISDAVAGLALLSPATCPHRAAGLPCLPAPSPPPAVPPATSPPRGTPLGGSASIKALRRDLSPCPTSASPTTSRTCSCSRRASATTPRSSPSCRSRWACSRSSTTWSGRSCRGGSAWRACWRRRASTTPASCSDEIDTLEREIRLGTASPRGARRP